MALDILSAIKSKPELRALADIGADNAIAVVINAEQAQAVPITIDSLKSAAPQTLATLASGATATQDLESIGQKLADQDLTGLTVTAGALSLAGKMRPAEFAAVSALIAAAQPVEKVTHDQVSAVLSAVRAVVDGAVRALPIDWSKV
jgi:Skp family chaperone for outer membrane proteins